MSRALLRAVRLIVSPNDEWQAIRHEETRARTLVALFVLPLALIPAASWSLGLLLFGNAAGRERDGAALELAQIVPGGLIVFFCVVLSIGLCAVSIVVLAPLFGSARDWPRALQV